jgi:hypothetical protein
LFHPVRKLALVKGMWDALPFSGKWFGGVWILRCFITLKSPKQALLFGSNTT